MGLLASVGAVFLRAYQRLQPQRLHQALHRLVVDHLAGLTQRTRDTSVAVAALVAFVERAVAVLFYPVGPYANPDAKSHASNMQRLATTSPALSMITRGDAWIGARAT